jgi:hypothetical protein
MPGWTITYPIFGCGQISFHILYNPSLQSCLYLSALESFLVPQVLLDVKMPIGLENEQI